MENPIPLSTIFAAVVKIRIKPTILCLIMVDVTPTLRMVSAGGIQIYLAGARHYKCVQDGYNFDWLLLLSISSASDSSKVQCPVGAGEEQYLPFGGVKPRVRIAHDNTNTDRTLRHRSRNHDQAPTTYRTRSTVIHHLSACVDTSHYTCRTSCKRPSLSKRPKPHTNETSYARRSQPTITHTHKRPHHVF